jgi:hypothetical protein
MEEKWRLTLVLIVVILILTIILVTFFFSQSRFVLVADLILAIIIIALFSYVIYKNKKRIIIRKIPSVSTKSSTKFLKDKHEAYIKLPLKLLEFSADQEYNIQEEKYGKNLKFDDANIKYIIEDFTEKDPKEPSGLSSNLQVVPRKYDKKLTMIEIFTLLKYERVLENYRRLLLKVTTAGYVKFFIECHLTSNESIESFARKFYMIIPESKVDAFLKEEDKKIIEKLKAAASEQIKNNIVNTLPAGYIKTMQSLVRVIWIDDTRRDMQSVVDIVRGYYRAQIIALYRPEFYFDRQGLEFILPEDKNSEIEKDMIYGISYTMINLMTSGDVPKNKPSYRYYITSTSDKRLKAFIISFIGFLFASKGKGISLEVKASSNRQQSNSQFIALKE